MPAKGFGRPIVALMRASTRHPIAVIVLSAAITLVAAEGLTGLVVRSADYDLMPDWHPSAQANARALNEVPGFRDVETMWVEVANPAQQNITDETSVRAIEEAHEFIQSQIPQLKYVVDLAQLVKLVNYTASGAPNPAKALVPLLPGPTTVSSPDMAAYRMPNDTATFQRDWGILKEAAFSTVQAQTNDNFTGALLIFIYDVNVTKEGPSAILPLAARFVHVAEQYRDQICPNSRFHAPSGGPVFNCAHVYVLGQSINGHMTELAQNDFLTWGPIVFIATMALLFVAFRETTSTLIAMTSFSMGLVWTYGLAGYLGIPLTFFGLLIVPITLGVGKEYSIYVTSQWLQYRSEGLPNDEVTELVARRAGVALLLASATSLAGLVLMLFTGFGIMRQLGILAITAFVSLLLLSITFIPAAQSLRRGRKVNQKPYRPSNTMGRVVKTVQRHRVATIAVIAVLTLTLAYESLSIQEYFGIAGGFRANDYVEQSYEYFNQALGGSGTELVVIEGNIAQPSTLAYIDALDHQFESDKVRVPKESNVASLMLGLRTYYNLRYGLANPAILTATASNPNANIPNDPTQLLADMKAMYYSPVWAPLIVLFASPDGHVAITHVFYKIQSENFAGLDSDWNGLTSDVAAVPRPSTVTDVNLVGTQDTFYLYVKYGMPLLPQISAAAAFVTGLIAVVVFRRWRDVAAIVVPMTVAGVWWAGLLPMFGVEASLTLMLPTILLMSVGSDYAIQYVWNHREIGSLVEVYRTTGKANLYVVAATVVAFLLFVPMQLVLSSQSALAAALAILCIFIATTIMVPLFYPTDPAADLHDLVTVVPIAETRRDLDEAGRPVVTTRSAGRGGPATADGKA
ncbi:MAG: MMPL family transporter [Thermoplasmatota archaeon]